MSDNSETRFLNDLRARQTPRNATGAPKTLVDMGIGYADSEELRTAKPGKVVPLVHLKPERDYYGYWAMFALGLMAGACVVLLSVGRGG